MKYDHHWMPPDRKMNKVPERESQKLFLVSNINKRKVPARKKKMLKFHAKAKACSTSKMKYDQRFGRNTELMSLTGNPQTRGAFNSPIELFFNGRPALYWPMAPVELIIHSSILINRGFPMITDSDFSKPK